MRKLQLPCCALLLVVGVQSASAFALLGPFAPWMLSVPGYVTNTFGYEPPIIGGPMNIGQGYRWNIPIVTYAYDQSFLNFFGTNGVAAVEAAIQILNSLPPASAIAPTNFPIQTEQQNYVASQAALIDLKSGALSLLLEQMGLASPMNSLFCLSSNYDLSRSEQAINLRNFDPETLSPSLSINNTLYDCLEYPFDPAYPDAIYTQAFTNDLYSIFVGIVDPTAPSWTAVAAGDTLQQYGSSYTGLTMDDAGGLKYLLSTNNIALESVLAGVSGTGTNSSNFVNRALRPGVDKITFERLVLDAITGQSFPVTNQYIDTYQTNGVFQQQTLQRVITQPDIVFSVKYLTNFSVPAEVTGTGNWVNNGAPGQDGPGVIQSHIKITFNALGQGAYDGGPGEGILPIMSWGSFDGSSNAPITYPIVAGSAPQTTVHLWLYLGGNSSTEINSWSISGSSNSVFHLQSSSNLIFWTNVMTITNFGNNATFADVPSNYGRRYFRIVGQ